MNDLVRVERPSAKIHWTSTYWSGTWDWYRAECSCGWRSIRVDWNYQALRLCSAHARTFKNPAHIQFIRDAAGGGNG